MLLVRCLLLLLVVDITSCLSTTPADHVVVVNGSTIFECSSNQSVIWSFRRVGQLVDERVYVDGQLSDPRFSVNRSADDWYGLVISDVRLSDAGLYTCIDNNGFGPPASARLVVLDSLPTCGTNVSAEQPVLQSQVIELRCTFIYAGSPPPRIRWTSAGTGTINGPEMSTTQSDGTTTLLESWIAVTAAAGVVSPYRYTITAFDDDDADDGGTGSTLTPTYIWNSPSFVVQYPVRDVIINASDDLDVAVGELLRCRADGFPPARYEWTDVATGRTLVGPDLRLDAEGPHTYQCTATNVVANAMYSARARVSFMVIRPPTADSSATKDAGFVTTAVIIATVTTAVAAAVVVNCVFLIHRLSVVSRRRQRVTSSSTDSAIIRQQVRCPSPVAAAAGLPDTDGNSGKRDAASCLYDTIDEQDVGYEQLPGGRLSTVQQAATGAADVPDTRPPCCHAADDMDAVNRSPRKTPVQNDYLYISDESEGETGHAGRAVRYVQPQQQQAQHQSDELYVNARLPTTPGSAAAFGVYIHTL